MKTKSMIAIILSFAFVSMAVGVMAADMGPIISNGTGTATVNNAGPSITATAIKDGGAWVGSINVNIEYDFYVNVSDANFLDDISQVTLEMWVDGKETANNPNYRYKFIYVETTPIDGVFGGTWTQLYPTPGTTYINIVTSATPAATNVAAGSYVFVVKVEKSAQALSWKYNATVTDSSGVKATSAFKFFNIYKYIEMSYDTDGLGSQNFAWTGLPGSQNVPDTFDVTVTSNSAYTMSAAYQNRFYNAISEENWANEPSLEVDYTGSLRQTLGNMTYVSWRTFSVSGGVIGQTTSHTLYLDFETVLRNQVYTGVTIYIRASV